MMEDKTGSLFMPDRLVLVGLLVGLLVGVLVGVLRGQNCGPLSAPVGLLCAYMPCWCAQGAPKLTPKHTCHSSVQLSEFPGC